MGKCGCKPCANKETSTKKKESLPFTMCVGNYHYVWDGTHAFLQDRKYQIPDGTYTSITFADGCIVGVGEAPLPVYTPQQCCDVTGTVTTTETGVTELKADSSATNLVTITNDLISVSPLWTATDAINVTGYGTVTQPWKVSLKLSKTAGNVLSLKEDGLWGGITFGTSDDVTVTGNGTATSPYKFTVNESAVSLAEINEKVVSCNGFTIQKTGLVKADSSLKVVTNLRFDHKAFNVLDTGKETVIIVDETALKTGSSIKTKGGITGTGVTGDELTLNLTEEVVSSMLDVIKDSATLKAKLKTILGV